MEPKKEQVIGVLKQAAKMVNEVIELQGVNKHTPLYRYLNSVRGRLRIAIGLVNEDYETGDEI